MDYYSSKRRRRTVARNCNDNLKELYPHDVNLFTVPPLNEILLSEFQEFGMERVKVLQLLDTLSLNTNITTPEQKRDAFIASLKKENYNHYAKLFRSAGNTDPKESDLLARRRDHISHFILRLAYCHNPDNSRWFVNQEVELFRLRFFALNKDSINQLMSLSDFSYVPISQEEKEQLHEELLSSTKLSNLDNINFYKIPFQELSYLLRGRKGYLNKGLLYIPQMELASLFISQFRKTLNSGLIAAHVHFNRILEDERLNRFLTNLPECFSGMNRVTWSTTTTPIEMLDDLSKTSFPLCMRVLHEALKTHHHLKNQGRMQYALFIKGIGVTMDDALKFWQNEFTKIMDIEKYEKKQYPYQVRHLYGKEGRQKSYTPYGCNKIIQLSCSSGEYHGCPYKQLDAQSLRAKLCGYGLSSTSVSEITQLTEEGKYTLACMKYFDITHRRIPDKPINHPNSYFEMSRDILTADVKSEAATPGTPMSTHSSVGESGDTPQANKGTPKSFRGTPKTLSTKFEVTPAKRSASKPVNIEELLECDEFEEELPL